ncbi:MAG: aminoacyl-tRNA hydrolase [bacterium]|jgi:PTH1 family peptidyl-tRNA hydrolase
MKLVVGLGNPGREYEETRHNAGFLVLDYLARSEGIAFKLSRFYAELGRGQVSGADVLLAKPLTYMNRSGLAVGGLVRWYKLDPSSELLVISDDLDLPLGRLRIRRQGSHGGHRGLLSVIEELDSHEFVRLRIGIGRPAGAESVIDKVLGSFTAAEGQILDEVIAVAADAVRTWLSAGTEEAMNRYNGFQVEIPG